MSRRCVILHGDQPPTAERRRLVSFRHVQLRPLKRSAAITLLVRQLGQSGAAAALRELARA